MEVFFKRTMQQSYMVIENELYMGYDVSLISRCRMDGFFPVQTVVENGMLQFWYEIDGLQMLDSYLEEKEIDDKWLRTFVIQIENMLVMAEKYLLLESSILLSIEQIGVCVETGKFYFCYLPGYASDIKKQFQRLMEELLTKVDHKEKKAVDLAYAVYEMTLQENYNLGEIKEILSKESIGHETFPWKEMPEEKEEYEKPGYTMKEYEPEHTIKQKETMKNVRETVRKRVQQLFEKKQKKENPAMQIAFEPDEEEEIGISHPTVLLNNFDEIIGKLNYNGRSGEQDFFITKDSFLIGTKEDSVDGMLHSKAVSRIHAKIRKQGSEYFIEDLNSKNGTWLNGEILNYKTSYPLKKNDKICFADEEYVFS